MIDVRNSCGDFIERVIFADFDNCRSTDQSLNEDVDFEFEVVVVFGRDDNLCECHFLSSVNDMETSCVSLIKELQKIWDEVGEHENDRDKMLYELEQECLEAYRRKVDQASSVRAQLKQAVADSEAKLGHICASLGERCLPMKQSEPSSLKKELAAILPQLDMMQKRKTERKLQFKEIIDQIHKIYMELCTSAEENTSMPVIDESDLSLRRLEEFKKELHELEKEKSDRLKQVLDHLKTLHSVCLVLGMDFKSTICGIHPTLENPGSKRSISADTIQKLSNAVRRLNEVQDLATTMVELWNLMDIPNEEQQPFQNVIRYIAASESEITESNALSLESLKSISRLQQMKSSKIMEVLMKKRADLEQLCRQARMPVVTNGAIDFSVETLQSGAIDPLFLLKQVELQISNVKEEAFSRKDILEKIDKWSAACEEESWLDEYNMDQNRYNAGKGTHILLKRAERARILVQKIPAMVEMLREKAEAWEQKRGVEFTYDGVSLLSVLDDYEIQKEKKDQERQRQRDQKKVQGQLIVEKEARFGSNPSPFRSGKKLVKAPGVGSNERRGSVAGVLLKTAKSNQTQNPSCFSTPHNRYPSGGHAKIHAGKSNAGSQNRPYRQTDATTNAHQNQTTPFRKPLSPVYPSLSSNANINSMNDRYRTPQKMLPINKSAVATTPATALPSADEENIKTPKTMTSSMPSTPATALMKVSMTPSTPFVTCSADSVEYSFEELRAGRFPIKI
ncbi:65-kDa microtubule-associated protein 3-like protein [Tanacetum coccineum]